MVKAHKLRETRRPGGARKQGSICYYTEADIDYAMAKNANTSLP
jgi:hypothetical protein